VAKLALVERSHAERLVEEVIGLMQQLFDLDSTEEHEAVSDVTPPTDHLGE